jgi:hypothetical protein
MDTINKLNLKKFTKTELQAKLVVINLEFNRELPEIFASSDYDISKRKFENYCKAIIEKHFEGTEPQKSQAEIQLALHFLNEEDNAFDNLLNSKE